MMRVLGEVWTEGGFTLALFQGWGMWSEELLEQAHLNFSFLNKFITLLSCGHPVDNNTFSKICVFKSLSLSLSLSHTHTHTHTHTHIFHGYIVCHKDNRMWNKS
jgi:hypothetical protein